MKGAALETFGMLDRRNFLSKASMTAASFILPSICTAQTEFSSPPDFWAQPRELWLQRGKEVVKAVYWYDGRLNVEGYDKICWLLRDVQATKAVQMSLTLLDVLRGTQGWLSSFGIERPLVTHSGFRTFATNGNLEGAVFNSLHTQGRAWDGHIPGVSINSLGRFGQYLSGGGVGFYVRKSFVHLDDGRKRSWNG